MAICINPPAEKASMMFVFIVLLEILSPVYETLSNIRAATAPTIPTVAVQNCAFAASHLQKIHIHDYLFLNSYNMYPIIRLIKIIQLFIVYRILP